VEFEDDAGATFETITCDTGTTALSFLAGLAKQRNLVITNDHLGKVIFKKSISKGIPVANLSQGSSPQVSVKSTFDGQGYFSSVTGIEPVSFSFIAATDPLTIQNPHLRGVSRPLTFQVTDSEKGGLSASVEARMGRMFGNMASYVVTVPTWRDSLGRLWTPNTFVNVFAPDAMIYTSYKFLIRSITLRLLSFVRITRGESKLSVSKVDPGGGANISSEHFSSPGDDSYPLESDIVAILPIPRSRGADGVCVGYADIKNPKKANMGDKRIYARDSSGNEIAEIWIKNTGEVLIDNGNGTIKLEAGGNINLNGVIITPAGAMTTPGTIVATGNITAPTVIGSTDVSFGGKSAGSHTHGGVNIGTGTSGPPS